MTNRNKNFIVAQSLNLGFLRIRFYSLTMVCAIIVGYAVARWSALKKGMSAAAFDDLAFWLIIIGFISARIYYVLFYWQSDFANQSWTEIFKVWHGGLAIYGALIGGLFTLIYFARKNKIPFLGLSDILVLGLPLAQAVGRIGNFFNYEAFGGPTNLPWKMFVPKNFRPAGYEQFAYFHPTFAYEMIWNIAVFAILLALNKKTNRKGVMTAAYLFFYSIGRFLIEGIRLDSAYFGPFRGDQITAVFLILLSLAIMINAYGFKVRKS